MSRQIRCLGQVTGQERPREEGEHLMGRELLAVWSSRRREDEGWRVWRTGPRGPWRAKVQEGGAQERL